MPLALTPVFSYPDVEYADDTVIIAKVAEAATMALQALQEKASHRGLFLNMGKTKEVAMNSDLRVTPQGTEVKDLSGLYSAKALVWIGHGLAPSLAHFASGGRARALYQAYSKNSEHVRSTADGDPAH
eukprot:3223530-Alexandrium_andersonii.AAC.1